jgi:hypothetical protein
MGRDTTAIKRMAAKRSREKEAGLRRLNVALKPEVFEQLTVLMKHHNCTSQASLVELLVMSKTNAPEPHMMKKSRNEVTMGEGKTKNKVSIKQPQESLKKTSPVKSPKNMAKAVTPKEEEKITQMSLF